MAYLDSTYKGVSYSQPPDDILPEKKDRDWRLKMCKYIYSFWASGNCAVKPSDEIWMTENRSYMNGTQDITKYQDWLLGGSNGDPDVESNVGDKGAREGWANISWDIYSPMPKYRDEFKSLLSNVQHETVVAAEDKFSSDKRTEAKAKMWLEKIRKTELDQIRMTAGLGIPEEEPVSLPRNITELNLYDRLGVFKLQYERAMKQVLDFTFSKDFKMWVNIEDKIKEDLFATNMAFVINSVNVRTQQVEPVYCPPEDVIVEWNRKKGFDNSRFFGVCSYMTIRDFRSECGISEDEAKKLATRFQSKFGNKVYNTEWDANPYIDSTRKIYCFDDFVVPYMQIYWKSLDQDEKSTKERKPIGTLVVYQAKWVIGTDFIWDDGYMTDQIRPKMDVVELPFSGVILPGKSMVKSCIPMLDAIQMSFINMQLERAAFVPSGFEYDLTQLENVVYGGKKMNIKDIIEFHRQTGNGIRRSVPLNINPMNVGSAIRPLEGGATNAYEKLKMDIDYNIQKINEVTGIFSFSTGGDSQDMGLGVSQMMVNSTNNAVKPLYDSLVKIKECFARSAAYRIQIICMYNKDPEKGYYGIIGVEGVEAIKVAGEKTAIQYGISIREMPTAQQRMELKQALARALAPGRNGKPIISTADFMWATNIINTTSNYTDVISYLKIREQEADAYDMEMTKSGIEAQGQQNQMLAAQQHLNQLEIEKNKAENKQSEEITKGTMDIILEKAKAGDQKAMQEANKQQMTTEQKLNERIAQAQKAMNPQPQQPQPQEPQMG